MRPQEILECREALLAAVALRRGAPVAWAQMGCNADLVKARLV